MCLALNTLNFSGWGSRQRTLLFVFCRLCSCCHCLARDFFQEGTAGIFTASWWHSVIQGDENKITFSYHCCYSDCGCYHSHLPPIREYEDFPGVHIQSSWWHISHFKQMLHSPVNFSIFTRKMIFLILTFKETGLGSITSIIKVSEFNSSNVFSFFFFWLCHRAYGLLVPQ